MKEVAYYLRLSVLLAALALMAAVSLRSGPLLQSAHPDGDHDRVVGSEMRIDALRERVQNLEALRIEPRLVRIEEHQGTIEWMLQALMVGIAALVAEAVIRVVKGRITQ